MQRRDNAILSFFACTPCHPASCILTRSHTWQPRFITTKTPTSPPSRARPSPSSATARKATPRPRTCATAACNVVIGQRPGGKNYDLAISHGFKPMSAADAAKQADVINILVPDELQGDLYENEIKPNLKPGNILMCSHGFNIHFGFVKPPAGRRRAARRPQRPRPPRPQRIRRRRRRPLPHRHQRRRERRHVQDRPGLRQGHRRHPRRRHPNHHRRRNRNRPLRRTGRPLRRRERAGESRLRNAGRSRLPARDGLLRMHARAEADRRPVLPGRPQLHALQRLATRPNTATTPAARGSSPTKPRRR